MIPKSSVAGIFAQIPLILGFFYLLSLGSSMSGMEIFGTALVLLFIAQRGKDILTPSFWLRPPFSIPILVFVGVVTVGILINSASLMDKLYDLRRMRFLLFYFVLFHLLEDFRSRRNSGEGIGQLLLPFLLLSLFMIPYGFLQHFVGVDWFRPEGKKIIRYAISDLKLGPLVIGSFNHHLTFSNIYSFFACVFLGVGLLSARRKPLYIGVGLLLFLLIMWTQSRTGWIAVVGCLMVIAYFWRRKSVFYVGTSLVVVLAAMFLLDGGFRARIEKTLFEQNGFYSPTSRVRLWHANWELLKENPWFGIGYNNNERRAKEVVDQLYPDSVGSNFYGHAHSDIFQLLSTTGFLGFLAYLWIWFGVFYRLWNAIRSRNPEVYPLAVSLFAAFCSFHLQGLTQWNFGDAEVLHNLMFWWAVTGVYLPEPEAGLATGRDAMIHSASFV